MIRSATAVLVVDGKYAMQLRDKGIKVWPDSWGLFGGVIEPGESSLQALRRELLEELEIEALAPRYLGDFDPTRVFVVDASGQWPRHVLHEGQAVKLFTADEVLALPLNAVTRAAIEAHRSAL